MPQRNPNLTTPDPELFLFWHQAATILMPAGLIALFWPLTSASLFLILYGLTAVYFSGVMVRARA